jgi:hypothetical protein
MLTRRAGAVPLLDLAPIGVAVVGLAMVVAFDLGTTLPFNDEWAYQWVIRRFAEGHGFHFFPGQSPIAMVQLVLGCLVSLISADPTVIRLTAIPFIAASSFALYGLSRSLGADRFFAGVAAAAPFAIPVYAASVTGYMTEPYYLALLMLAAMAACRWLATGRGAPLTLALFCLAALQRQHAAALPPALTIGLLLASRQRDVGRGEWVWLGAAWVAVAGALVFPALVGLQTDQMRDNFAALTHPTVTPVVASLLYVPGMTGLGVLAFAGGLAWRGREGATPWWRRRTIPAVLGLLLLVVFATFVLPGNYLTPAGLNPITVAGAKPWLYGSVMPVLKGLCLLAFVVVAARPFELWPVLRDPRGAFLLVLGALAVVPLINGDVFDRYFLSLLLPWLPVAAALTRDARWRIGGRAWALAALVIGLALYAAGEQDYQSWQVARAEAERQAIQRVPASEVFSGFEPYAIDAILPAYERTGRLPGYADRHTTTLEAPRHTTLGLLITAAADPRPGIAYNSLAPGKIVIVCVAPTGCPR